MKKNYTFMWLAIFTFFCRHAQSQSGYAYTERTDTTYSEILKEKRPLKIYLPEGYDKENIKYPVIYIIDGETRCTHAVPTIRFISSEGFMPKSIVVGIPNVNRNRDFLPVVDQFSPAQDSAYNFLHFIRGELFPYIEKNYKAGSYRILIGHSYGGLFSMYALITQPDAFSSYIMIDPSFWYGSQMMVRNAATFFAGNPGLSKSVYIGGVEGEAWNFMGNHAMDSVLKVTAPKNLQWKTFAYANENHGSVTFKTIYDGLRFIFSDYNNNIGELVPLKGMIVEGKPYDVTLFTSLNSLFYTTDGTAPGSDALKLIPDSTHKAYIRIDKSCTLKLVSTTRYEAARMITGEYKTAVPLEPAAKTGKYLNGLKYKAYEGSWDSIPDFSKLKPFATGVVKNFNFPDNNRKDNFGIQYDGFIYAAEECYYDLGLTSDDGSRLFIDNRQLLDNDGLHAAGNWLSYRVYLKKGYHAIHVDFFEKTGDEALNLEFMKYPWMGEVDGKIPDDVLFYKE
jgi:predicted alpha/beta superfamily hydrolase